MKRRNKILLIGFSATLRARWTNESVNDRVKKLNIHLRWPTHTHTAQFGESDRDRDRVRRQENEMSAIKTVVAAVF